MEGSVLVLDFGSQYTQLIARRIRELGVFSEIKPCTIPFSAETAKHISALILSGGPASVKDKDAPPFDPRWLEIGKPILGVCYGMQLIADCMGGKLGQSVNREYGFTTIEVADNSQLFQGFELHEKTIVWMSHADHVVAMPPGFKLLAKTETTPISAMANPQKKMYAVQFHPEVVHTARGRDILSNFLFEVALCKKNWDPGHIVDSMVNRIRSMVPENDNVICALSGGVDSTVAAALCTQALGDRLHCIFVDNGVLRRNEHERVMRAMGSEGLKLNVHLVDASDLFLKQLAGVTDPEQKRKIIGRLFIEVFEKEAKRIPRVTHLVQGTLYPDVIESVSVRGPSVTIKSHHNVGGLPERMNLKLIEPFREFFKDEVRQIGRALGMSDEVILRQPFPGPGLAVRILGEVTKEALDTLREADHIFVEEIKAAGLYHSIWQSFAVLLPISSVGVMGDNRTYEKVVALRAVASEDGMTADWCDLPKELLRRASSRIINEVKGVNRVVYDISSKPPATIEWE